MRATILLLVVVGCAAGCVPQKKTLTRGEWLATTTRTYDDKSADDVLVAAEEVLRYIGDEVVVAHQPDGIYATRPWIVFAVLAAANGTDHWRVGASEGDDGVTVSVEISRQGAAMAPLASGGSAGASVVTAVLPGAPINETATYDLFFLRMDYLLGLYPEWLTCKEHYRQRVSTTEDVWGNRVAICQSTDDIGPDGESGWMKP